MIRTDAFIDEMMEGLQVVDPQFRYVYVNRAAATHAQSTPEELVGKTMMDCYPGIEETEMFEHLQRCLQDREPHVMRNLFTYPDGSRRWFELRMQPVDPGVLILSSDVTETVEAESELQRNARAARTLSLCNRTLVRATSEHRLVRDVCRLICAEAGYEAAWVGLREDDDEVRWRSSTVTSDGALALPDTEPVAAQIDAILSGEVTEVVPMKWAEELVAVLPVPGPAELLGVLVLAAPGDMLLDEREFALVEEIAWDLGFGVHTLRLGEGFESEQSSHQRIRREHSTLVANLPGLAYRCRHDENWTILSASDGAEALTGFSSEYLLDPANGGFSGIILPEDLPRVRREVTIAVADNRRFVVEYRIRHADGGVRWVAERGVPVVTPGGVVLEGFMTDVTARREAADAEHLLNLRLLELAETVRRIAAADGFGQITSIVTKAARRLLNADRAALAARRAEMCRFVAEDAHAPGLKGLTIALKQCVAGWAMLHEEAAIVSSVLDDARVAHDVYASIHASSVLAAPIGRDPAMSSLVVYWEDEHAPSMDEVQMLQALADSAAVAIDNVRSFREVREREALVEAVLGALPSAIFIWRYVGDDFELTRVNEAAKRIVGDAIELVGQSPGTLEFLFPGCAGYVERCLVSKRLHHTEVESEEFVFELTFGFVTGGLVVMRADDVTEQRQMERRTRASQRLEAVGQLAAGVAHDFNNLLTVINSYTELSIDNIEGLEPTESFLREVLEAGKRAAALTGQLLAYSRRQMLAPEALSVNAVVENVDPMLRRVLSANIDIQLDLDPDIGTMKVDPAQLEQVIVNLSINASDAMQAGGVLKIETANVALGDSFDWGEDEEPAPGSYVMLSVADTGVGMTPETLDKVFEPFFTTKHFGRGTGLGLAMVHGVVTQSGGQLRVFSEPDVGTTFKIYFPRVDVEDRIIVQQDHTPTGELVGLETVLVAEDERALRELVERVLTQAGYAVLAASNGEEALRRVAQEEFDCDLLVTDVVMPKMGGRELAEALAAEQPDVRVLYISGYTNDAIATQGVIDEQTNFLSKPFSAKDLLRTVRHVLDS